MMRHKTAKQILEGIDSMLSQIAAMQQEVADIKRKVDNLEARKKVDEDPSIPSIMREWMFGDEKEDKK